MKIIIELEMPDDDKWALDPPTTLAIHGKREGHYADHKGARFTTRGVTGGKITSIRYRGETL